MISSFNIKFILIYTGSNIPINTTFSGMIFCFDIKFILSYTGSQILLLILKRALYLVKYALLNHPIHLFWFSIFPCKQFIRRLSLERSLKTALKCVSTALGLFSGLPDLFWTSTNCLGHLGNVHENCYYSMKLHDTKQHKVFIVAKQPTLLRISIIVVL